MHLEDSLWSCYKIRWIKKNSRSTTKSNQIKQTSSKTCRNYHVLLVQLLPRHLVKMTRQDIKACAHRGLWHHYSSAQRVRKRQMTSLQRMNNWNIPFSYTRILYIKKRSKIQAHDTSWKQNSKRLHALIPLYPVLTIGKTTGKPATKVAEFQSQVWW